MKIEEIKVGMRFKENDKRLDRVVTIEHVDIKKGVITLRSGLSKTSSRKPNRFHREPRQSGYTLIQESK